MLIYKEKFERIRDLCLSGGASEVREVLEMLNEDVDLPTTRAVDFYLGTVDNPEGLGILESYLFEGTQIQRNYCTLFFARRDDWHLVNRAYDLGLVDALQAYSR